VLLLTFGAGIFAGAEIAVLSIRRTRLRELASAGNESARMLLALRDRPERLFATVQLGITCLTTSAAVYAGAAIAPEVSALLSESAGAGTLTSALAAEISFTLVIVAVAFLFIVFGELVPKSLALRFSERIALFLGRYLAPVSQVARPFVSILTGASNLVLRPFKDRATFSESRLSPEELRQLVEEAAQAGSLDPRAAEIADRALDFGRISAGSIMVPRPRMVAVASDTPLGEVRRAFAKTGHIRLPVFEGTVDHIVGIVTVRDVLAAGTGPSAPALERILRPVHFVPETARAARVLADMQTRRAYISMVVDESGGVAGLLTIEDLLEELVGEIFSEHEVPVERFQREPSGAVVVPASTPVRDANRELGLELPESDDFSTIGGLCMAEAGRIPAPGERMRLSDETTLEVVEATQRRVRVVRLWPPGTQRSATDAT